MADTLDHHSSDELYDEHTIVVSLKRSSSAEDESCSRPDHCTAIPGSLGISTPPTTPKRAKKRVRFSDPGPALESDAASSGLTPFIRRASLSTPTSKGRHSTPAKLWNLTGCDSPISGKLQFEPMRQVLDGRVKRRLRRRGLSEETNSIEVEKRIEARFRKTQIEELREQLAAKDNTTSIAKVRELEQRIVELEAELERKDDRREDDLKWRMPATEHFDFEDDRDVIIGHYDKDFSVINDELMTTPTRLKTSFPSPPATVPNTPSKSTLSVNIGVQASLPIPDLEKDVLNTQLLSLELELSKLKSAIGLSEDNHSRLAGKLSDYIPIDEPHDHSALDSALDAVLTQLAISQSLVLEKEDAFSAVSNEIASLGFPNLGPEETLQTIRQQFRQARLDLEYATPGEVIEGFENDKLLELLVSRVQVLVQRVKDQDASIDQYHEQELLLRQQLNTRLDAQHDIQRELYLANTVVQDLRTEIDEKEVSNERLQKALDGYRAEVKGLEFLIESVEQQVREKEAALRDQVNEIEGRLQYEILKHDTTRASDEGKDIIIVQLELRLNDAVKATAEVHSQMVNLTSSTVAIVAEKDSMIEQLQSDSKAQVEALALRYTRVSELLLEIDRLNKALEKADSMIISLRSEVKNERTRGILAVEATLEKMDVARVPAMEYINGGEVSAQRSRRESSAPPSIGGEGPPVVVHRGSLFDGTLARRSSGKKRRRYDSGLGFLEEGSEVDVSKETVL